MKKRIVLAIFLAMALCGLAVGDDKKITILIFTIEKNGETISKYHVGGCDFDTLDEATSCAKEYEDVRNKLIVDMDELGWSQDAKKSALLIYGHNISECISPPVASLEALSHGMRVSLLEQLRED